MRARIRVHVQDRCTCTVMYAVLHAWMWSKYIELCIRITVLFNSCAGVNKEDTLPTILFSKEKLEMGLKATAGQKTEEEADQPGNLIASKASSSGKACVNRQFGIVAHWFKFYRL